MSAPLRHSILRGLSLALLVLFLSCASSAVINQGAYTKVVIDNQEWQDATIDLYCGIEPEKQYKVSAANSHTSHLFLANCHTVSAKVRLLGSPRYQQFTDKVIVHGGDELHITIPNNMDYVFIAVFLQ